MSIRVTVRTLVRRTFVLAALSVLLGAAPAAAARPGYAWQDVSTGTTAILRHLLDDPVVPLCRADAIVEWGVAVKRALPWPSTVNDVVWGAWYCSAVARRLPRRLFEPRPAVDAGVLVFERRDRPLVPPDLAVSYRRFVAEGFRRRADARELDAYEWASLFRRGARAASGARPARAGRRPRPRRAGS